MSAKGPIKAESAEVTLNSVHLPFGLIVERIHVRGNSFHLDPRPLKIELDEPARFEAAVTDLALQAFLEGKKPGGLRDFYVQLTDGQVHVHATGRVLIEVRAAVICQLEIVERKQVFIRLLKVELLGVAAKKLIQKQLDEINPILDVSDLPVDIELERAEVANGRVVLFGTLAPKLP